MNSSKLSTKLSAAENKLLLAGCVVAFLGFVDALYLTVHHYIDIPLPCTILNGCDVVTTSAYSTIGPIPIASIGAAYYMVVFFGLLLFKETGNALFFRASGALVALAFAVSAWLVYLQGFVLHSWCQYCIVSAIFTTLLFCDILILYGNKNRSTTKTDR